MLVRIIDIITGAEQSGDSGGSEPGVGSALGGIVLLTFFAVGIVSIPVRAVTGYTGNQLVVTSFFTLIGLVVLAIGGLVYWTCFKE